MHIKAISATVILLLFARLGAAQADAVVNPTTFPGSDIGAKINNAFAACSQTCIVQIPAGKYIYKTTINMTSPGQSLVGAGSYATTLNYDGSGDGLLWQMNPFSTTKAGVLRGLSVIGTAKAANCIHSGSLQGSTWEDITVSGCTGSGASGILLENIRANAPKGGTKPAFTERTYMRNVHIGYSGQASIVPGNTHGLVFRVSKGGAPSFGYNDLNLWLNVESNQIGVLVDTSAQVYHSNLNLKGNMDTGPASFLTVNGQLIQGTLNLLGEVGSNPNPDAIHIASGGQVYEQGTVQLWGGGKGTGGIAPVTVDSGGFYAVEPWIALDYPATSNYLTIAQRPFIETGYQYISSDGTIIVAQAAGSTSVTGDLQGRLILSWPNNTHRMATMIIDVACAQYEKVVCSFNIPVNYAYARQAIFSNPTLKLSGGSLSVPQIQVTIGNRNGISQNVVATWYGVAGAPTNAGGPVLFPGTTPGTADLTLVGRTEDYAGNDTVQGSLTTPKLNQSAAKSFAGSCSMSSGTTCTFKLGSTFTNYLCFPSIDHASTPPAIAISAVCSLSGTTATITAGTSNSLTWDALFIGNPD
ncbi:MAG: hypothetical protein ABSC33_16625 [Candidatus Sulfotelmatobacter sp.]